MLLILPSGSKSWRFNYARPLTGKRTKMALGGYPELSLADARAKREEYRALLAKGIDPQEEKIRIQQEYENRLKDTFHSVAESYFNGIYKEKDSISYPIVELTKQLRDDLHLSEDFIVLHYEVDEFLTLYKVSNGVRLKDAKVFEAEVFCNDKGEFEIDKPTPMFDSFEEYFEDFLDLAEED